MSLEKSYARHIGSRRFNYRGKRISRVSTGREVGIWVRCVGLVFLNLCSLSPAWPAGFMVNSTVDAVDVNPADGVCETAPGNGECTLRAAIQEADALAGMDDITLPAGTYVLTIAGAAENVSVTGDLDITTSMSITGAGADVTIIDGGGLDRVFDLNKSNITVSISAVTIRNGFAGSGGSGGGITTFGCSTVTFTNVVVRDNVATSNGGGINNVFCAITITNSTIANNSASSGGGIYNEIAGELRLVNTTISGNQASGNGGGLMTFNNAVLLNNVTITGNTADSDADGSGDGGGVYAISTPPEPSNTIIAGNTDNGGEAPDCSGTVISRGYNLLGDNTGCSFNVSTGDLVGSGASPVNPLLLTLANNGSSTLTHALLAGSPALGAADPAVPGSGGTACEAADQRGTDRILNAPCDIGAFEADLADLQVSLADSPDPVLNSDGLSYLITVTNAGPGNAGNVVLTDTLPAGVVFASAIPDQGSCMEVGGVVNCDLGTVGNGASENITINTTVISPGTISNTVLVSADEIDPDTANNTATENTTVNPAADLALVVQGLPDPVVAGAQITYTFIVANNGPDTATGVVLTDTLAAGVDFVSTTPAQGSCSEAGGMVTCNLGSLASTGTITVATTVLTNTPGTLSARASVQSNEIDPDSANNNVATELIVTAPVPGTLQFTDTSLSVEESARTVSLAVVRVGGSDGTVSVDYTSSNGTALAGADYEPVSGTLQWLGGDVAAKTITITLIDDTRAEVSETFQLILSNAVGGASLGSPAALPVTITDMDPAFPSWTAGCSLQPRQPSSGIDPLLPLLILVSWLHCRRHRMHQG